MTQFQFDVTCKIIENGAPALANELCSALASLVQSYNNVVAENQQFKSQLASINTPAEAAVE